MATETDTAVNTRGSRRDQHICKSVETSGEERVRRGHRCAALFKKTGLQQFSHWQVCLSAAEEREMLVKGTLYRQNACYQLKILKCTPADARRTLNLNDEPGETSPPSQPRSSDYSTPYKLAGSLVRRGLSYRAAARLVLEKTGTHISHVTARHASEAVNAEGIQLSPVRRGVVPKYPRALEDQLVQVILSARQSGVRTSREFVKYAAALLIQLTETDKSLPVNAEEIVNDDWFGNFVKRCTKSADSPLSFLKPKARASTRDEWETIENMRPHYDKFERFCLEEGISEVNPNYDPHSNNQDPCHVSHQKIIHKQSEMYRVHSFDEVGWTPDLMENGTEAILCSADEVYPTVYATKSSSRCTFIGGSRMDGMDLPMFGIFPTGIESTWVSGAPNSRIPHPTEPGKFLPARFTATDSGGITNESMLLFFKSIIEPITPNCESTTGKRHIQLTDSAGPHCCLGYLKLLSERGILLCPRTPNLSHRQQNEDLCNFGKLKLEERKARQVLQNTMLMDARRLKHGDKIIKFNYTMDCIANAWLSAFDEKTCRKGYEEGGYHPYTRKPMVLLVAEQEAKKSSQAQLEKRRKINRDIVKHVSGLSVQEIMDRINSANPAWKRLPDPIHITPKTKISKAVLAQMEISPSSAEVMQILKLKEAAKGDEEEQKKLRSQERETARQLRQERGFLVFKQVSTISDGTTRSLESLSGQELDDLAIYKGVKWKMADGTAATRKGLLRRLAVEVSVN